MDIAGIGAIVTGGASGLGAATATALAEAGARVAVFDTNAELAAKTAAEIGAIAIACDITDADATATAVAKAREANGPARICVNCAGVGTVGRVLGKEGPMALSAFARTVEINLTGSFNVLRLVADDMQKADPLNEDGERGVIVNTASVAAFEGQIGFAAYSASKGGIVGMTLPLAREFGPYGIRVLAIAPGIFETPMSASIVKKAQNTLLEDVTFPKRLGKPAEYAALVLHMARNPALNGEVVRLDHALRMRAR
ncbi:MAG: SDR family NAD(P)-dependent oxidoreductase [Alphaproteobacteria bacterium]